MLIVYTLSAVVFITATAALVGLINPRLIKFKNRFIAFGVFLALSFTSAVIAGALIPESYKQKPTHSRKKSESKETKSESDLLEAEVRKVATKNLIGADLTEIVLDHKPDSSYRLQISLKQTHGDLKTQCVIALGIFKDIYQDNFLSRINDCTILTHGDLVDKYGKKSTEQVGRFTIARAVSNKVTWENLTANTFLDLMHSDGQLWLHPAFCTK